MFARITNNILLVFTIWLVTFAWAYFYIKNWGVSLLLSISFTITAYILLDKLTLKANNKAKQTKAEKDIINSLSIYLTKLSEPAELIKSAIPSDYEVLNAQNCKIEVKKNENITTLICIFKYDKVTIDDVLSHIRISNDKKTQLIILCNKFDTNGMIIANSYYKFIRIFEISDIYKFLRKADKLPDFPKLKRNKDYVALLGIALNRQRGKYYLTTAVIVLISGLISFFPIYSMITSLILLVLGIYSLTNKRFNASTPTNILP